MKFLILFLHLLIFLFLTLLTQIGGLVYLSSLFIFRGKISQKWLKRLGAFLVLYVATTFLIVPIIAPVFGREKIQESQVIEAHSFFYVLANRNYVRPAMNDAMNKISQDFSKRHKGIKVVYLDANFPFIDGFPLLPHLSHNDGQKIDISFVYNESDKLTNRKPSVSGYGVYEHPKGNEYDQIKACKAQGNWHYDFPQYLTFGSINKGIKFSEKATRDLAKIITNQPEVGKLFIEPHLKQRLNLTNTKVRFHGCQAVRHDDHIHFQLR